MIIPSNAQFYIERRPDVSIVFQRGDGGVFQRVQKFTEFDDAKRYVKAYANNLYYFYDDNGARVREDGTGVPD